MKFKELSKKDIKYIDSIYSDQSMKWDDRMSILQKKFDKSERSIRTWIKKLNLKKFKAEEESEDYVVAKSRELREKPIYLFSWAQNATDIHSSMLANMKAYANFLDADIHIILGRYKNPTSTFSDHQKKQDWWNKEVIPYADANRHKIHPELTVLSDLKTQPTAIYPLSSLGGLSKGGSIIVGSPKMHLEPFPVLKGESCKFAISTGAITRPNYTDSKSGKIGEFFHMYGFTIVELDGDQYYFRQVQVCDDGSFIDLDLEVKKGKINQIKEIEAAVLGDVHHSDIDAELEEKTFSFLSKIRPKVTVLHDLFNGNSVSHHDKKDPVLMHQKFVDGRDDLRMELSTMMLWLEKRKEFNLVVISSNHNDWIDRWINGEDWKRDITNSLLYSKFLTISLEGKADKGLIAYLVEEAFGDEILCLGRDESYKVKDYELAYHGDQGQSGSKGSLKQFAKLNTKVVVGDYHSGARIDGAIGVGTMTPLRVGYNKGASKWNNCHAIIHSNGKAQHLIFRNNKRFSLRYE